LEYGLLFHGPNDPGSTCVIVDVSLGGVQTRSRQAFEVGKRYRLVLGSDRGEPFEVVAEVRHSNLDSRSGLYSTGFRFVPQGFEERMAVVDYVHAIFQEQGERLLN
jgi:hypothetical protein